LNIELNELHQKILDATISMKLKDEDDENTINKIEEEFYILEEDEISNIPIESESLISGNTMDLNSPNFIVQSLNNIDISSESFKDKFIEEKINISHSNVDFDVDAL
ncbi:9814_t:CDS:2, partial [Cetraspora pellucida]